MKNTAFWGYTLAIIGSACYGLNPLFTLPLYEMDVNPLNVLFYRYGISAILIFILMLIKKENFRMTKKELLLTLVMGILFAGSSACLFFSFKFMDAGLASVILFTYPLFVALLSSLVFHEKISRNTMLCVILALFGISLINQEGGTGKMSLIGTSLAITSGFMYALYLIGVNRSALKIIPTIRLSFYALLTGTLLFFIANRFGLDIDILPNCKAWVYAIGLSLFPTIISIVLITKSTHIIGSTPTSIIGALEPITALLISLFVFGGVLTGINILGIFLVLGAVTLIVYTKNKA